MHEKILRHHLWAIIIGLSSTVLTLLCLVSIWHYSLVNSDTVNFKETATEVVESEIRPKEFTLDFFDKAEDVLGDDYSYAISYARKKVQIGINDYKNGFIEKERKRYVEDYKRNKQEAKIIEVEINETTKVETRTYNTSYDIPEEISYDSCNFNDQERKLVEECKEIITKVLGKENEIVLTFEKIKIAKMQHDLRYKVDDRIFIRFGTIKPKDRNNEAVVLLSDQLFITSPFYDRKKQKMIICWVILEEYYHALDPILKYSSYRFK